MPEQPLALDQINAEIVRELLRDLVIECTSSTQVVIKQDSRAGSDDGQAILHAASDLTLDITASGKNGLDTGAEAADTWYYIWMIYNPGTQETAGLLSASATSPTLPSGFTKKRLVGAVRNNGSSDFILFVQRGVDVAIEQGATYLYNAQPANTNQIALDATSAFPSVIAASRLIVYGEERSGGWATGNEAIIFGCKSSYYHSDLNMLRDTPDKRASGQGEFFIPDDGNRHVYFRQTDTNAQMWVLIEFAGYTLNL